MRRGDNIPPVSDYAHWNEDAERVWYEENRYDMEHADEWIEDDDEPFLDDEDEDEDDLIDDDRIQIDGPFPQEDFGFFGDESLVGE